MANATEPVGARHRTWQWYIGFALVGLVIVALLVGAWMLYSGIAVSIQAEKNLHATLFTIRLVEQFVHEYGRWPHSWRELEQMSFPGDAPSPLITNNFTRIGGSHSYNWPAQFSALAGIRHNRLCCGCQFDNQPGPYTIPGNQTNRPVLRISRQYGFVESLQETLKNASANKRQI